MNLLVVAKAPVAGRSKTRLCPPCTAVEAAALAEAALADTLAAVAAAGARPVLALDGKPGPWLPPGFRVFPQRGGRLDERLANAWDDAGGPGVQIGMDTPQLTPEGLEAALAALDTPGTAAVLGPAADGGWWALGLRRPDRRCLLGIPMSTSGTGRAQRLRLESLGLRTVDLPELRDVDVFDDAVAVAATAPCSRFAAALRRLPVLEAGPVLRGSDGSTLTLAIDRWRGPATAEEGEVLDRTMSPVLDVGCGPGRHTLELASRGLLALGVDASPLAVRMARRTGAPVLERSIFGRVPGAGRWRTAVLLDGNVGIGGDPVALLHRLAALLRPDGRVLAEVEPPGSTTRTLRARVEHGTQRGPWFRWALVGADDVAALGHLAGFARIEVWRSGDRWFAQLDRQ